MMQEIAYSPNFKYYSNDSNNVIDERTNEKHPIDDINTNILIYEDRVFGWFLKYGEQLQKEHNAGFVVLQIAIAQIEGIEQLIEGESSNKKSKPFFVNSMKKVFNLKSDDDVWLEEFYSLVRCGLFHDGMTRKKVRIQNRFEHPIEYSESFIYISPNKFLDSVIEYFKDYILRLKKQENATLRNNFVKYYDNIKE